MIGRLRAVKFRYSQEYRSRYEGAEDRFYYNFIAQEYREVFPGSVTERPDGYLAIETSAVTPYLVESVQELVELIEAQQRQIDEQARQIEELRALITGAQGGGRGGRARGSRR